MYDYELYKTSDGFGFKIKHGDNAIIVQDYSPDKSGYVPMTEDEAITYALEIIERLGA